MKKIEAVIQPDMLESVIKVLRKVGVGGFSVLEAKGQGSAEPPLGLLVLGLGRVRFLVLR